MGKCCRNCRWYQLDISKGHICVNSDNEYGVEWVAPYDCCEEWESEDEGY